MNLPTRIPIPLFITEEHVAEMLERYDAGMCDRTRSNVVCLALRPWIAAPESLKVFFKNGKLQIRCGAESVPATKELGDLLRMAEKGATQKFPAIVPNVWIPLTWLRRESTGARFNCGKIFQPKKVELAA